MLNEVRIVLLITHFGVSGVSSFGVLGCIGL